MTTTKLVIIGGVAAGASCAARARRLNEFAQITLIERGPDVSFANCGLPYFIGGEIPQRDALAVQTPDSLKAMLNLDVRTHTEAVAVDRAGKRVQLRHLPAATTEWIAYDKLVLAPARCRCARRCPALTIPGCSPCVPWRTWTASKPPPRPPNG